MHQSTKTKEKIRGDDDPGPDEPASTKTRDPQDDDDDDDDERSQPGIPFIPFSSVVRKLPSEAISTLIGRGVVGKSLSLAISTPLAGVQWESRSL